MTPLLLPLLLLLNAAPPAADSVDVLVRGGTVYDGSGGAARRVDLGIRGNRIVFVGDATRAKLTAGKTIDASGLIVAPGFIDPHTHSFEGLPKLSEERRRNAGALMQGVTTVVTGADGRGPLEPAQVLSEAERLGIGTNTYTLAGFGSARVRVMGNSSAPASPAQIDAMRALIAKAMSEGAFGVGSGLFYAPQSYASTEEVVAVVMGAKPYGGVYDTHQRDESSYTIGLLNSVREAIRIGRETGLITNIGHVKALGVDVWGKADSVLLLMREERARGHMVVADQYPWTASGTSLGAALLARWSQAGGRDSLLLRIADAATRDRILADMRENLRRRGGDSTLLLVGGGAAARPYLGKTLKQVAAEKGSGAVETALELIRTVGDIGVASFNMNEQDIETFMKDPYVMTSSDGSDGHPRLYGTYPRKIRRYVLDKPVITMQRMVRASSGQVAEVYGIPERGQLKEGFFADVIVFDPKTIRDEATYVEPTKLSTGMRWVFVNGQTAVAEGIPTGVLAGKGIRESGEAQAVTPADTVFLLDCDNTLLDNDAIIQDLRDHLTRSLGREHATRYWAIFEQLREELGYADYLGALQRFRRENPSDNPLLLVSAFLLDYPFTKRLYPGALQLLQQLRQRGPTVILSDGDVVFQPRKIQCSGLWGAVEGRVLIYIHKEAMLDDVAGRYPGKQYVMVDDKLRILAAVKQVWGDRVTTVFPRQGHYALDPKHTHGHAAADVTIERIGDLLAGLGIKE